MATQKRKNGFTLIEAMFATMIVGLGIVALMLLLGSSTRVNAAGNNMSSAVFLAEELRAMTDNLDFTALAAKNNASYQGVDAAGKPLAGLTNYRQTLFVEPVDPVTLGLPTGAVNCYRLTAVVTHPACGQVKFSWLRTNPR